MNKFTSITLLVLFFILLSITVSFASFSLTPKIKASRSVNLELQQEQTTLQASEKRFDKGYVTLQQMQEKEGCIDNALQQHFDLERFEEYLKKYFNILYVKSIESEQIRGYQYDTLSVVAVVVSPLEYYHFIDALNSFEWVVELQGTQEFKQTKKGIEVSFNLKVYTALPK